MSTNPTGIKAGDYIKIPKGTTIVDQSKNWNERCVATSRESVAQVASVYEDCDWVYDKTPNVHGQYGQRKVSKGWYVTWSNGGKRTKVENVTVVPAPAPKKETVRQPTLQQRMAPKTEWKLTDTVPYYKTKVVPVTYPGGVFQENHLYHELDIPAGEQFKIDGKTMPSHPLAWPSKGGLNDTLTGYWVNIVFTDGQYKGKKATLRIADLKDKVEQIGEAEAIPVFAIWDTAQQKYYTGYDWDYGKVGNLEVKYSDKLTKAKKFKRLADVRVHALIQSGYYDNLPESWGAVPDWMCGGKMFEVPDTWEIVKFDKLTNAEIERIELIDTFKRSWKLRALTVKYGSAVRKVYSDFEKKDKLTEYSAVLVFNKKKDDGYYWYDYEFSEEELAEIKEVIEQFDKQDIKFQKGTTSACIAVKDVPTAMMARLAYAGELDCALIDFDKMEEVVVNQEK